jgi:hypothetical protein
MQPAALDELIEFWALLDEDRALVAGDDLQAVATGHGGPVLVAVPGLAT